MFSIAKSEFIKIAIRKRDTSYIIICNILSMKAKLLRFVFNIIVLIYSKAIWEYF